MLKTFIFLAQLSGSAYILDEGLSAPDCAVRHIQIGRHALVELVPGEVWAPRHLVELTCIAVEVGESDV